MNWDIIVCIGPIALIITIVISTAVGRIRRRLRRGIGWKWFVIILVIVFIILYYFFGNKIPNLL